MKKIKIAYTDKNGKFAISKVNSNTKLDFTKKDTNIIAYYVGEDGIRKEIFIPKNAILDW